MCLTLSLVIALMLLARRGTAFRPVLVAGSLLVVAQMLARVYLGAHYPTDVVGSIIATTAAVCLVMALSRLPSLGVLVLRAANRRRSPGSRSSTCSSGHGSRSSPPIRAGRCASSGRDRNAPTSWRP